MRRFTIIAILLGSLPAYAGPAIQPGDIGLRHDIQVLADYGVIRGPVTTWPLSWDAIAADLQAASDDKLTLPVAVRRTMDRLLKRAKRETERGRLRMNSRLSVAEKPNRMRSFAGTPRERGELLFGVSWAGQHLSLDLNVTGAYEPDDEQEARADGSQIAFDMGNLTLAASTLERWWGPGWDGSLILSNNARPIPAITLSRIQTDPFKSKWLRWIGPWDFSLIWGQLEEERFVPNARFFGLRFNFRPVPSLEIGISRTAQWCGDGRPCDFDTFKNLFLGKDNVGDAGTTPENEPGNQLAGFDMRWTNMWFGRPLSIYTQFTGEDEAGGFPSRYLAQFGLDTSGYIKDRWSYRWYAELAGTSCDFVKDDIFNCAYNHGIYETGYRYEGQVIGHHADNDARIVSTGLVLVNGDDSRWHALIRFGDLNRGGAPDVRNTLTPTPLEISSIDLTYSRSLGAGRVDIGLGYQRLEDPLTGVTSDDARGFLTWRSN
ncbi:MAG: capsule assembly Wzi family protein [Proteobacteria bacterium]|nr:capsule assembly Wzi family protein [Pseudomonadota bacterium]